MFFENYKGEVIVIVSGNQPQNGMFYSTNFPEFVSTLQELKDKIDGELTEYIESINGVQIDKDGNFKYLEIIGENKGEYLVKKYMSYEYIDKRIILSEDVINSSDYRNMIGMINQNKKLNAKILSLNAQIKQNNRYITKKYSDLLAKFILKTQK